MLISSAPVGLIRRRRRERRRRCRASRGSARAGARTACATSDGRPLSIVAKRRRRRRRLAVADAACGRRRPSRRSPRGSAVPRSSPARYASSPAPTSGSSTGASGVSAAAGRAAEEEQQVPPEEKRFLEVVGHAGALAARVGGRLVGASHRPPASRLARLSMMSRISKTYLHERRLALHLLRRPVAAAAPPSRLRIVPGADEKM